MVGASWSPCLVWHRKRTVPSTLTNHQLLQVDADAAEAECRGQLEEVEGRIAELEAQLALGDMKAADGRGGRGGGGGSAGGAWVGAYCRHTSRQVGCQDRQLLGGVHLHVRLSHVPA